MRLELITPEDLWLNERLEGDPQMMVHFGGPRTLEEIARVHQNRLDLNARGEAWMHKILPDDSDEPLGSIGYWKEEWQGRPIHEMGWMVLPEHWGKGVATAAGRILLDMARAAGDVPEMHAFPVVTNGPSNAVCRKLGFEFIGECDFEFAGRPPPLQRLAPPPALACPHLASPLTAM